MEFGTAINCMDGRIQIPVIQWIKDNYDVKYVDMITEPGPLGVLSDNINENVVKLIKKSLNTSVNIHKSELVAIVGHYDCAGNPVNKETQITQMKSAINLIKSWNFNAKIIGLWVDEDFNVFQIY